MTSLLVPARPCEVQQVVEYTEARLKVCKLDSRSITKALLLTEEMFIRLTDTAAEGANAAVQVRRGLGHTDVVLSCRGEKLEFTADSALEKNIALLETTPAAESAIRGLILRANRESLTGSYKNGVNKIRIAASVSSQKNLLYTLAAMGLAIVLGFLFRMILPAAAQNFLNQYVFTSVKTLFMNALKLIMCPVVFFSIASCISSFTDLSELGKLGGKVMGFYCFTTLVSVTVGLALFYGIRPGAPGGFLYMAGGAPVEAESISILDTFLNIVPSNLVSAFLNADTMQLIFLAVIVGIAAGRLSAGQARVSEFLKNANELFLTIASMITKGIPLLIFASITSLIMTTDLSTVSSIGTYVMTLILGNLLMIVSYCALVLLLSHKSPLTFLKQAFGGWINAFALCSSSAAMPNTMEVCDRKLHIMPKLYSFAIPLGATINMDGLSLALTVSTLFFARAFNLELTAADVLSMLVTIVILTMGCPGIPGGGFLCMSVLMAQFGIPMEAMSIAVSVFSLMDPIATADNVLGDMVGTYVIASRNGYLADTPAEKR